MTAPRTFNFQTLQCGRGVAALAVVLFHANLALSQPQYLGREPAHIFSSGFSGVYYFFVLSGTVMLLAHWDQIGLKSAPWTFYRKRFNRIYLPLWGALVLTLPFVPKPVSLGDVLLAFSAVPVPVETVLPVEWTLRHEVLFYALFGFILWRPTLGFVVLIGWFFCSILTAMTEPPFPASFLLSPLHILFGAGMFGAFAIKRGVRGAPILAALGIAVFAATWLWQAEGAPNGRLGETLYGVGALLSVIGFARMEISHALTAPAVLRKLGDASYALYLVHLPVVEGCAKFSRYINEIYGAVPTLVYFACTVAIAIGAGFAFHFLVEKPFVKWTQQPRSAGAAASLKPSIPASFRKTP